MQEVLSKAKDYAGAAVGQAKEGISKVFDSAKDFVSGFGPGKESKTEEL